MKIKREDLYRFPWSRTDNPGGWIEVTDDCDLFCLGCYRHRLEGHRDLDEVKEDIIACQSITNCDCMRIAGGEPLIYPNIVEVVDFISRNDMKPVILTNGVKLTRELATELKNAGLVQFTFHIDSNQNRPGWEDKTEVELNELRQHFADLIWEIGGVQTGYNVTVFREIIEYLPDIVQWCRKNIHKVQQLRLIAARGIPSGETIEYMVNGRKVDLDIISENLTDSDEMNVSSDEIFETIAERFPHFYPCAYLNGTSAPETNKILAIINIGDRWGIYGRLGARSVEFVQTFNHFFNGKYGAPSSNSNKGKKVFVLSLLDREVKKAAKNYLKMIIRNPQRIFSNIHVQTIGIMQPGEIYKGKPNLCDGCINMMLYKGQLVNSCILDEYRMFGGALQPVLNPGASDIDV